VRTASTSTRVPPASSAHQAVTRPGDAPARATAEALAHTPRLAALSYKGAGCTRTPSGWGQPAAPSS